MAKIARVTQSIFGSGAPAGAVVGGITVFGSMAAGSPTPSTSVATIQGLAAWAKGWLYAVVGQNGPGIEDMNALFYVITTQLAYLFQAGVAEWDSATPYYIGSLVNVGGVLYTSLTDGNTGNAVTDATKWAPQGLNIVTVTGDTTMDPTVDYYRVDATGGAVQMTLPALTGNKYKKFAIKKVDSSANVVTVKGNGSELVDFANTFPLAQGGDSMNVVAQAAVWDIV